MYTISCFIHTVVFWFTVLRGVIDGYLVPPPVVLVCVVKTVGAQLHTNTYSSWLRRVKIWSLITLKA
jgi:hypothetical protein